MTDRYQLSSELAKVQKAMLEITRPLEKVSRELEAYFKTIRSPAWDAEWLQWGKRLQESIRAAYPPNWSGFTIEEVSAAFDVMMDHGLNLAWVPRGSVVREILTASDAPARDAVLIRHEIAILEDVEASVDFTQHADLVPAVQATLEALQAFRDGHHRASQALAAVTLGAIVHDAFGDPQFAVARKRWEALDPEDGPFVEAKWAAVMRCAARALQNTTVAGPGFNRHAAAHSLCADQYTKPNAMTSMMLVAGLLREIDGSWAAEVSEADS